MSLKLTKAREYEAVREQELVAQSVMRPCFHLTPRVGWMNDPNGFSWYQGQYHLFYQYYPYEPFWGPMHWGHAVSKDLLHWTYLPAALAPDETFDCKGCFSGSAETLEDQRHLLVYTGVTEQVQPDGSVRDIQEQCLAIGDGVDYKKYEKNPVMRASQLPAGYSKFDFRDPKVFREPNGSFHCVTVGCDERNDGRVILFRSENGLEWEFQSVLAENNGRFGTIWECPDFFSLDGKHVLIVSPMQMEAKGLEYPNGNGVVCQIGTFQEDIGRFTEEHDQSVDYGIDFYAPQTMLAPDGRRIMIGWMQNWEFSRSHSKETPWFGQMTTPRELSVCEGRLIQKPVKEIEACRKNSIVYHQVRVKDCCELPGIAGRVADIELEIAPENASERYHRFEVRFAQDDIHETRLRYCPDLSELEIDRSQSGSRQAFVHKRSCKVRDLGGRLKLRILLDRFSAEVFVNDGEQVLSTTFYTEQSAEGISFCADKAVEMNIAKYDLE